MLKVCLGKQCKIVTYASRRLKTPDIRMVNHQISMDYVLVWYLMNTESVPHFIWYFDFLHFSQVLVTTWLKSDTIFLLFRWKKNSISLAHFIHKNFAWIWSNQFQLEIWLWPLLWMTRWIYEHRIQWAMRIHSKPFDDTFEQKKSKKIQPILDFHIFLLLLILIVLGIQMKKQQQNTEFK